MNNFRGKIRNRKITVVVCFVLKFKNSVRCANSHKFWSIPSRQILLIKILLKRTENNKIEWSRIERNLPFWQKNKKFILTKYEDSHK